MSAEIVRSDVVEVEARIISNDLASFADSIRQRMADHLSPEQNRMLERAIREACGMEAYEPFEETVDKFLRAKSLAGRTDRTIKYYRSQLEPFVACSDALSAMDVSTDDVLDYLARMKMRGVSDTTLNNVRRVLSSFFGWCEAQDIVHKSVMRSVEPIKQAKLRKYPFSVTETTKLREACRNMRDRALVEFMLSTGARLAEISGLNRTDIDLDKGTADVFGKGRKERRVYISEQAAYYIRMYFDETKDAVPAFCSLNKKDNHYVRIEGSGIENVIRTLGKDAGVENCHPHRFRRTFATNALKHGMPIEQVQRILGHEKVETTLIYAIVNDEDVAHSAKRLLT